MNCLKDEENTSRSMRVLEMLKCPMTTMVLEFGEMDSKPLQSTMALSPAGRSGLL